MRYNIYILYKYLGGIIFMKFTITKFDRTKTDVSGLHGEYGKIRVSPDDYQKLQVEGYDITTLFQLENFLFSNTDMNKNFRDDMDYQMALVDFNPKEHSHQKPKKYFQLDKQGCIFYAEDITGLTVTEFITTGDVFDWVLPTLDSSKFTKKDYMNLISCYIWIERFEEAWKIVEKLSTFSTKNKKRKEEQVSHELARWLCDNAERREYGGYSVGVATNMFIEYGDQKYCNGDERLKDWYQSECKEYYYELEEEEYS